MSTQNVIPINEQPWNCQGQGFTVKAEATSGLPRPKPKRELPRLPFSSVKDRPRPTIPTVLTVYCNLRTYWWDPRRKRVTRRITCGRCDSSWSSTVASTFKSLLSGEVCLRYFQTVGWKSIQPVKSSAEVQRCRCLSGARCILFADTTTAVLSSNASWKSRMVYHSGANLPRLSWKRSWVSCLIRQNLQLLSNSLIGIIS